MTDAEIDNLSVPHMNWAIARAMEPNPPTPDKWGPRFSPLRWFYLAISGDAWNIARGLELDGGNIAVALLEQVWKWGWRWSMEQADSGIHAFAFHPDRDSTDVLSGSAPTLPFAVARLFLRIVEARKAKP